MSAFSEIPFESLSAEERKALGAFEIAQSLVDIEGALIDLARALAETRLKLVAAETVIVFDKANLQAKADRLRERAYLATLHDRKSTLKSLASIHQSIIRALPA